MPETAELHVLGAGVWTAHLAGRPISEDVLEPGISEFRTRIAARRYPVADLLRVGENELLLQLGEGAAHVRRLPGRYTKFAERRVAPRARVVLHMRFDDGTEEWVESDDAWEARLGPTSLSHWYGGEAYDARTAPSGWPSVTSSADWVQAEVVGEASTGPEPWRRSAPPQRVIERLEVVTAHQVESATVLDFGVNISGRQHLEVSNLPAGTTVRMWPSEHLDDRGWIDQRSTGGPVFDSYVSDGNPGRWHPQFSYHGFRYLGVEVLDPEGQVVRAEPGTVTVTAEVIHTDNTRVGRLELSDPVLARVDELVTRAAASNLASVPTDCPHREKLGWLEQDYLVFDALAFRWDIRAHWNDIVVHMVDAQTDAGLIPSIAPELVVFDFLDPGFRDDVNWGGAIWHIPAALYRCYGDLTAAQTAWTAGVRYLEYLEGQVEDDLLDAGLGDWITLCPTTPRALVATYGLARCYESAAATAGALAKASEAVRFRERADELRAILRERFGTIDTQAGRALLLDLGAVKGESAAEMAAALAAQVAAADYQIEVGEIALPALVRVLARFDQHEVLYRLVTQDSGPGYGQMVADDLTALGEHWTGARTNGSVNHFMLGYISSWFIEHLAGLSQHEDSIAWQRARIAPQFIDALESATADHVSANGRYAVGWQRQGETVHLEIQVPPDGGADLSAPSGYVLDDGRGVIALGPGTHVVTMIRRGQGR
ncbi:family 78 glycoside hydrolase catalytic domain [Ruania alba]|nr:family 78 glycoside hydrolase catalytic domain [Ruania alba]